MKARLPLRALIVFAAITLAAKTVFACSCGPAPPVLDAYEFSDAVVIARVLSIEPFRNDDHPELAGMTHLNEYGVARLVVEKAYAGRLRVNEQFSFGSYPNAACIWSFRKETAGHRFLLYLRDIEGKAWSASTCGRSNLLENAAEDLLYLDNMEKRRGKTRVSGTYRGRWDVTLSEVANRTIRIVGEKNSYETKTNADGVFEIYDLPPGKYSLEPEIPNGWQLGRYTSDQRTPAKSLPFKLEATKHVTIRLQFEPSNAVEGRVVGPNGNPMKGVCVKLLKPDEVDGNTANCTDKNGEFRIQSVPEGSYVVALNADGKLSPSEPFPATFYPSVTQREKAALISIGNGETVKGINFIVSSLTETVTISGVVQFSDGKPVANEYVTFLPPKSEDEQSEHTGDEGRFTIRVLKGAKGEVFAEFIASLGDYEKCPELDALIKAGNEETPTLKSSVIKIDADHDIDNLVLQFPFPKCKKKE